MRSVPAIALLVALPLVAVAQDKGTAVELSKLKATTPPDWKKEKPANLLRKYQFKLPGATDLPDAEIAIFPEMPPDPAKNFPRWKAQFVAPEGKTVDDIGKTAKWDVPGATVNVLDVTGTWKYRERPNDPKSKEMILDDYRVIWVIVAEKDEAHHIRLSGPLGSVARHASGFEKWVRGLK